MFQTSDLGPRPRPNRNNRRPAIRYTDEKPLEEDRRQKRGQWTFLFKAYNKMLIGMERDLMDPVEKPMDTVPLLEHQSM